MTTVLDYEEIDMRGIEPRWYSSVPASVQARYVAACPQMRVLWNNKTHRHVLVVKDPAVAQSMYDDGFLRGWSIAHHWRQPLDVDQLIAWTKESDRWNADWLDRWAPVGTADAPPNETLQMRADRGISNFQDAAAQAEEERQQAELSDLVDDEWPNGKLIFGPGSHHGSQDIKDWMLKQDARVLDASRRAHSSGKQRPWHGLKHLRSENA